MKALLKQIAGCQLCKSELPHGVRPVVQASTASKILIIGQAPGRKVHETGIPWNDPSGKRLRKWLGVTDQQFYDPNIFALVPMGFCYPGKGKSGDLPPMPICAPTWHETLLDKLPHITLALLLGTYAQNEYLGKSPTMTKRITDFYEDETYFESKYWPLPHPSPRNIAWYQRNAWFEERIIPVIQTKVAEAVKLA